VLDHEGKEGRLVVLLDGLDEVPRGERRRAKELLHRLRARWPRSALVVTARPIGYEPFAEDFLEVEVLPLERGQRVELLASWLGGRRDPQARERAERALRRLAGDRTLEELSGNPLYLTLIAFLVRRDLEPSANRTSLHDQALDLLLEGRHRGPEPDAMDARVATEAFLRDLAYAWTEEDVYKEPVKRIEDRLLEPRLDGAREKLQRVPRWRESLRVFLDDLARKTSILAAHDGEGRDWRFWHRTFREAYAAQRLAELLSSGGEAAILAQARAIEGDLARWAEPYALLTGRLDPPAADALLKALATAHPQLAVRALATAVRVEPGTVEAILGLTPNWEDRARVYEQVPERVDEPERALSLLDRLGRSARDRVDLYFLHRAARSVGRRWTGYERQARELRERLYDAIGEPPAELFEWVETPRDGRVPLWADIPGGRFLMGSPEGEGDDDERPQHEVEVAPFRCAVAPVTNAQYAAFDPRHESQEWSGVPRDELAHHPVVGVRWFEAVAFCRWLRRRFPGARLPSEAEWEYACRAGTATRYWSGDSEQDLADVGWYEANSGGRTHRVGEKRANPWGLYDLHGNVWEWTSSPHRGYPFERAEEDEEEEGDPRGVGRVYRGGGFWVVAPRARAAYRSRWLPGDGVWSLGFRVVLPAAPSRRLDLGS
jgi:formylglycine-generating enzyme required for sulfatase activity